MGKKKPKFYINSKAGESALKRVSDQMETLVKLLGTSGAAVNGGNTSSFIACLESLNGEYYNGTRATKAYDKIQNLTFKNIRNCLTTLDRELTTLSSNVDYSKYYSNDQ